MEDEQEARGFGLESQSSTRPMPNSEQACSPSSSSCSSSQEAEPTTPHLTQVSNVFTRQRLQELAKAVDPNEQLDEDVEDLLLTYAAEYMDKITEGACVLASHRKSATVEVQDIQTHLERSHNIWIPGFGSDELQPYKRAPITEAHKQRLALIKKLLKKY